MKHRNAERLAVAKENARLELVKRNKPVWMKTIEPKTLKISMEKTPSYPSATARLSYAVLKKTKACPCDSSSCPQRNAA